MFNKAKYLTIGLVGSFTIGLLGGCALYVGNPSPTVSKVTYTYTPGHYKYRAIYKYRYYNAPYYYYYRPYPYARFYYGCLLC